MISLAEWRCRSSAVRSLDPSTPGPEQRACGALSSPFFIESERMCLLLFFSGRRRGGLSFRQPVSSSSSAASRLIQVSDSATRVSVMVRASSSQTPMQPLTPHALPVRQGRTPCRLSSGTMPTGAGLQTFFATIAFFLIHAHLERHRISEKLLSII